LVVAAGAEEMETVILADVLRRAGVQVTLAGLAGPDPVVCSRGVVLLPDMSLASATVGGRVFDCLVLPGGGPGAEALAASQEVGHLLRAHEAAGLLVGAVCAAPTALLAHRVFLGKQLTSYPAFKARLEGDYKYLEERVVEDGCLVTSRGPATTLELGLALAARLVGGEKAEEVGRAMLV